jgi:hypothetical protein
MEWGERIRQAGQREHHAAQLFVALSFHRRAAVLAAEEEVVRLEGIFEGPDFYPRRAADWQELESKLQEARDRVARLYAPWEELSLPVNHFPGLLIGAWRRPSRPPVQTMRRNKRKSRNDFPSQRHPDRRGPEHWTAADPIIERACEIGQPRVGRKFAQSDDQTEQFGLTSSAPSSSGFADSSPDATLSERFRAKIILRRNNLLLYCALSVSGTWGRWTRLEAVFFVV